MMDEMKLLTYKPVLLLPQTHSWLISCPAVEEEPEQEDPAELILIIILMISYGLDEEDMDEIEQHIEAKLAELTDELLAEEDAEAEDEAPDMDEDEDTESDGKVLTVEEQPDSGAYTESVKSFLDMPPVIILGMRVGSDYLFSFDNWVDFVDTAEYGKTDMEPVQRQSRNAAEDDWAGASFKEAVSLARRGWPEGVANLNRKIELIKTHIPARQMRYEMHMKQAGPGTLDYERLRSGHPEPWVVWNQIETDTWQESGKNISVTFNLAASAGVSIDQMFTKGAVACLLVDLLERTGKRVKLTLAMRHEAYLSPTANSITTLVPLKKSDQPLDIDRIAFAVAHSASFRRLGFSIAEQAPKEFRDSVGVKRHGRYGKPGTVENPDGITIRASSLFERSFSSQASQLEWLKEQLRAQGVEIVIE